MKLLVVLVVTAYYYTCAVSSLGHFEQLKRLKRIGKDKGPCEVDQYWNATFQSCEPCTHCSRVRGKTGGYLWMIRGCGADSDAVCGTISEFRQQLRSLTRSKNRPKNVNIIRRRKAPKKKVRSESEDEGYVYGHFVTAAAKPKVKAKGRRRYSATSKVRDTVKNASQRKAEFLKKLQQEENITLSAPKDEYDEVLSDETVEGKIKYGAYADDLLDYYQDYESSQEQQDNLHQELKIINDQLLEDATSTTTTKAPPTSMTRSWKSSALWTYSTRDFGHNDVLSTKWVSTTLSSTQTTASTATETTRTEDAYGHKMYYDDFIDGGGNEEYADSEQDDSGVYGSIVKTPKFGEMMSKTADEFGLLKGLLYRNKT